MLIGLSGGLRDNQGNISNWGKLKVGSLMVATGTSVLGIKYGKKAVSIARLEDEIEALQEEGRLELKGKEVRHRLAFAQKAQQVGFLEELAAFQEEFGDLLTSQSVTNLNIEDDDEVVEDEGEPEFRRLFPEGLDTASWKACCKALEEGFSETEVVREVLGVSGADLETGMAYLEFLKR
ncbi:MAG: hypothetical protein F6K31_23455 [Symploca sp. SIO2G7]|nr:hypothetical protein [Symploca sp. SIO2G7]